MDQGPLVSQEIAAGAELVRGFDHYKPIKAAFWLKASNSDPRFLDPASDQVFPASLRADHAELLRLEEELQSPELDPYRVRLLPGDDPLALAAAEINDRFPGRRPGRMGGTVFGGIVANDLYIDPVPLEATVS